MKFHPLYVEVTGTDYQTFGKPTVRNRMLADFLKRKLGGINESVPPGTYIFTIYMNWKLQIITDLHKV